MTITNIDIHPDAADNRGIFFVDDFDDSTDNKMRVTVKITGDGTSGDPTVGDKYLLISTPSTLGAVVAADGSTLSVPLTQGSEPNTFTGTTYVKATAYGGCKISGRKDSTGIPTWQKESDVFYIQPSEVIISIEEHPAPALQVKSQAADPTSGADSVTSLAVLVTYKGNNPVPECPVAYLIDDVRTDHAKQTGAFYDTNNTRFYPQPLITREAFIHLYAGVDGRSKLFICTNQNAGYIKLTVAAGSTEMDAGFVYIYGPKAGPDIPSPKPDIPEYISSYTKTNFPVGVETLQPIGEEHEHIGIFLNGRYQNQVSLSECNYKWVYTTANIADLIPGTPTSPGENILIGYRTSGGDLYPTEKHTFEIKSPLPTPSPTNPILGPMVNPDGNNINWLSIHDGTSAQDYQTTINLVKDAATLLAQTPSYTLKANDTLNLFVEFDGDYVDTDDYKKFTKTYPQTLTDDDIKNTEYHVPIPYDDIYGYGTTKDPSNPNGYLMFYNICPEGTSEVKASSPIVTGNLSTRK